MSASEAEVPESVTHREVREVLRTFASSGWTGMTLEVRGMRITAGKHGPPAGPTTSLAPPPAATAPPAAAAPAAQPPAAQPPAAQPPASQLPAAQPPAAQPPAAQPSPAAQPPPAIPPGTAGCVEVRSPAIGAFWVAPSPGQPPFVEVGRVVGQDEQLAIVEVMKLMNPVLAPLAGEIVQVCASDAEMVEYDQVLFLIRPSDG